MSRFIKGLLKKQLESKYEGCNEFVVLSTEGVSGNDNNSMRGDLIEKGVAVNVVKNSLMRLALKEMGLDNAVGLFSAGPCTVAFGGDSVVDVAKEVVDWSKKIKAIELKGAYVDGEILDDKGVVALSKMPSRVELQGQIVQLAQSPGSNVAASIIAPASYIAGCVKTIVENAEEAA